MTLIQINTTRYQAPRTRMNFFLFYFFTCNAVVTPLRKAALYEPRIAILGIWG